MGGKRQANILSSVISNFETVEEVIETSTNSTGSAMAENAKWLDSIEGKTYQFTNALETMWSNMLNAEVVKDVIDFGTKLIQFLDSAPGKITAVLAALAGIAKFKGFSLLGLGQDALKDFNNIKAAYSTLNTISQTIPASATMPTASIQAYATAVSSLTPKIQANMLASQGLTKAQIQLAMQYNGLSDDVIREATAHVFAKQSQDQESMSAQQLLAYKIQLSAANLKLTGDTNNLAAAEFLEANASDWASAADAKQAIMASDLTNAQKAAALSAIGQANANMKLGASFKALFASNPVGMILTIATTILSIVIPAVDALTTSSKEAAEAAEEAISKYQETQKTLTEQKKTIDELSTSYEKLSKGVDLDTNENISLTTDSYKEYLDICNDIADMYPHLVTGFDAQGNAILSLKGNVDELIQSYKDAAQAARQQMIASGGDIFDTFKSNYNNNPRGIFGGDAGLKQQLDVAQDLLDAINSNDENKMKETYDYLFDNAKFAFDDMLEAAGLEHNNFRDWVTGSIDVESFKQTASKLTSFIKSTTTQINTETSKVKSLMDAYLGEDLDYAALGEKSRSLISQIVSGFSAEFIHSFNNADDVYNWIKDNIISAFQDASVVDAINSLSDLQLEFAKGDMSYADYKTQLNEFISQIQNKVDEDALAQIKIGIGIDEASLQTAEKHILELLGGDDHKGFRLSKVRSLSVEDLQIAGQLEVPDGTILSWEQLVAEIEKVKIAATQDFDITNFTDAISAHSSAISEYQEALQSLSKGSFTMDDFMELIKKYPELAKGVDISSNAFHGLSRNLNGAIKTSTKNFIKDLKELRVSLVAAGKSTDSIDQLIKAIENMPDDALDDVIQKYSTLGKKIREAQTAQDKLLASMEENPNEGYETRGEALDYMKEAMKKGEIGSESNLWNVAEKYGFTYDSAKSINENADALAKFIAIRERWWKQDDDGDDRTDDGYSYKGTEGFIKDVESAVKNNADLQQYLTWDYDEETGTLNFDYNNEDWDTIVSILSKTQELAGLTSDEFADMMIQIGQYFGIDWGNYDDVLSHLNGIATGTSDAKTKVEEYGKAMQDYFGEDADVDLTTRPMVKFDSTNFADWEKLYQEIIENPDGHSEADVKNAQEQLAAIQNGDSHATVYSSTFSNDDGTKSVVVTPILPDGEVLSPEQLREYANKLLAGEELEPDINIKLAEFDGKDSIKKADEYAQALHKAQEEYDTLRDTLSINATIDENGIEGLAEIKEIKKSIISKDDGTVVIDEDAFRGALEGAQYTEDQIDLIIDKIKELNKEAFNIDPFEIDETLIDKGVDGLEEIEKVRDSLTKDESTGLTVFDIDMFTSVLQEAGYTKDQIDALIKKIQEYNNIVSVSSNTDPLGLNNASLSVDSLKASLSTLNVEFKEKLGKIGDGKKDLVIEVQDLVTTLKEKGWTDASIKEYIAKLSNNTNLEGFNVKVKGIENIDEVIKTANEVPEEETTEYTVTGTGLSTVKTINDELNKIPATKSTNYTITETTVKKTEDKTKFNLFDPSTWANGTANAQGTAFAGGSWGAPRTETALTGELGPEILVRNGRWTTVGENGAEFTQVKKGDIIFNHRQTEELLKNGYVTGRGKAYASGTAYSTGGGTFARYEFSGSGGWQQYDVNDTVVESWGDLSGAINDAADAASDTDDKFEETFDWVEVRLEEINEQLDLMNAKLENAADYASKNSIIDQIIGVNTNKMTNLTAGVKKYSDYAARLLSDVPAQYRNAAQDGAIAISEFAGEADEKTVKAIEKYREWAQKVADLKTELEGVKTEIRNLYIQKIDNAEHSGAVRATIEASQTEKLQNAVDFDEARGLITDPNYYAAMMENSERTIAYLTAARNEMQAAFDEAVRDGQLEVGGDQWYEELDKLYQIDAEIDEANVELEEFQNAINDIYWEAFDELIARFDYISEETQGLIDLMSELDMVSKPDNDNGWSADDVEWTKEGLATLGLHAQEMERAEEKAKAYAVAIDELTAEYNAGHYSESEYHAKLNELVQGQYDAIEAAQDEKEAIVELNEARVDAIKEGIEKQVKAYEKLIKKQKEELDAEKDLHGFQKSVAEQQKNIAEIERQLAALAYDNSISAVAKRKQLEAELAEAQYELQDTYYDRSVEDKQTALDKELETFQEEKDAEIEKWEEYLTNVEAIVAESLGIVQANATEIGATLTEKTQEYNLTVSDAVLSPWKNGKLAIDEYTTKFGDAVSSTTAQLDSIRAKWQEIKDALADANAEADKYYNKTAATSKGPSVADINKENQNYYKPTQTPAAPASNNNKNNTNNNSNQAKAITVGGKINASGAKIYAYAGSKDGLNQYYASDPYYIVLGEQNGYLKVRHHKSSSGVSGWFKKSDVKAYAKGTTSLNKSGIINVDELGEELILRAHNGRLTYAEKGTGVVPADITSNLMSWGELDPQDMLDRNRPKITAPHIVNNEVNINMNIAEVVHIDEVTNDTIPDLTKAVRKEMDSYMVKVNNAIKAKVR